MTNAEDIIRLVTNALRQAGIDFMLVGSFSSNFYGIPRSTQDADLVVALGEGRTIDDLARCLDESIELQPQQSFELFTATTRHELTVRDSAFRVELFRLSNDPHDQQRFQRRREVRLLGSAVWMPSPEDVIITKLRWLRRKDEDDIRNILAIRRDQLDWAYLREWCQIHGTEAELDRLCGESSDEMHG